MLYSNFENTGFLSLTGDFLNRPLFSSVVFLLNFIFLYLFSNCHNIYHILCLLSCKLLNPIVNRLLLLFLSDLFEM